MNTLEQEEIANKALCSWHNARTGSAFTVGGQWPTSEWVPDGNGSQELIGTGEKFPILLDEKLKTHGAFTRSHDSIHRVLIAMNEEEKSRFAYWIRRTLFGRHDAHINTEGLVIAIALATPAQKTTAALRALNLKT